MVGIRMALGPRLGPREAGSSAPAFTPLSLSPTVWYDPSDMSTLFQDSAGTVPVTATGQPVGRMLDKSGNGFHAIQATTAAKPVYTVAGALKYLDFDGVDDLMDATGVSVTQSNSISLAFYMAAFGSTNIYDGIVARQALVIDAGGQPSLFAGALPTFGAPISIATNYVMTNEFNGASSFGRINGTQSANVNPSTGALNQLRLGTFLPGSGQLTGRIYGMIIRDASWSAPETASVETYLGTKCGVVL